jgi:nicotinate-nucleotide adenylyltransferase
VIGLFGGAFDPPHNGHVELAAAAEQALALDEVIVLVTAAPGHKHVVTPPEIRLELARAAFPRREVLRDDHARTIDLLRDHPEWEGAVFLVGADQFAQLPSWKEPDELLRRVRLGVATRPGFAREQLDRVLDRLADPARVTFFELEPLPIASSELRARLERGEDVSAFVPAAVWELVERESLHGRGYTLGV